MGGGQTLNVGLGHPDRYAYLGAFSAATGGADAHVQTLARNAAAFNKGSQLFWIRIGKDDFLLQQNRTLVASLKKAGIEHVYEETDGAHVWGFWRQALADSCRSCSSPRAHRHRPPRRRLRRRADSPRRPDERPARHASSPGACGTVAAPCRQRRQRNRPCRSTVDTNQRFSCMTVLLTAVPPSTRQFAVMSCLPPATRSRSASDSSPSAAA